MKKIILFTIIVFVQNSFSQEIEKMDKKELRVAYQNLVISKNNQKDSLVNLITNLTVTNSKLLDEVNKIQQIVLVEKSKNTENINKISELQQVIKTQEEKIKILSVKPLKLKRFSKIPEEFKKSCNMTYSESKQLFQAKEYILFENKDLNQCLIYLDEKLVFVNFKEEKEDEVGNRIKVYSNENITINISNEEQIGGTETIFIYQALILVKDKNNQEIKIKVYGQGGC